MENKYFEKRRNAWRYLESNFPNFNKEFNEYQKKIKEFDERFLEIFDELEEKFPVEGFEWSIEPNDRLIYLECKEQWEEIKKRSSISLDKQIKCVKGIHHFKEINGMKWCSYCGTLIDKNGEKYFPENPHFLESQRKEGQ